MDTPRPKALVFDLMGTCLDWQSSVAFGLATFCGDAFDAQDSWAAMDSFAGKWRMGFFDEIQSRFEKSEPEEDIDLTHRRVLDRLLAEHGMADKVGEEARQSLVESWHSQMAWGDVEDALNVLKSEFFVVVLANGTTRLQLDLMRSSGLSFHTLFSSELLQETKPSPNMYLKALKLLKLEPSECMMVAAHAYDLRAAKKVGMSTAYIQRKTEDPHEDMEKVKSEVDLFVPFDENAPQGKQGLANLAIQLF